MDRAPRFAIVGSCCSRDLFEFGIPGFSPELVAIFVSRATAISMIAEPVSPAIRDWDTSDLSGFDRRCFEWDLDKVHLQMLARADWDVLLVDLATEYHPTLHIGGSAVTAVPRVRRFLDPLVTRGEGTLNEAMENQETTLAAIRLLAARMHAIAQGRPVIAHVALRATHYLEGDRLVPFRPMGIRPWNAFTMRCHAALLEHPGTTEVRLCDDAIVAGGSHRWALSPLHYDRSYFVELSRALTDTGLLAARPEVPPPGDTALAG